MKILDQFKIWTLFPIILVLTREMVASPLLKAKSLGSGLPITENSWEISPVQLSKKRLGPVLVENLFYIHFQLFLELYT